MNQYDSTGSTRTADLTLFPGGSSVPFGIPISSRRRRLATVASATLALAGASAAFSAPAYAAPANDNFANATAIGSSYYDYVTAGGATNETGEPSHGGVAPGATLWYSWTAPTDMKVSLNGYAYNFDYNTVNSAVAVYTGTSLTALTPVVSQYASEWNTSFAAVGGRTYRIALSGPFGDTFRFSWSLNATPKNDPFSAPKVISGATGAVDG